MKRDMSNAMLWGVCSGMAKHFNTDVSLIRLGFVVATLFFGAPILIYPIMALILPKD
jgi:phage shock protein PspC (stress-responsive transcriptional regulator)